MSSARPAPALRGLRGGLPAALPRRMPTLFTLFIFWWLAATVATVFGPWMMNRFSSSRFTDHGHLLLWATLSFATAVTGAVAYLSTFRHGMSPAYFLLGAAPGMLVAAAIEYLGHDRTLGRFFVPCALLASIAGTAIAGAIAAKREERAPAAPGFFFDALDRLAFMTGNLWFGIAQIATILVVLVRATIFESEVGSDFGNEAAYANYYNAPWFGALCVLFFVTLYAATMRKWPFRISQAGWLFVHAGLLVMIIGCLVMFFGSFEGRIRIMEGETNATVKMSHQRDLVFELPQFGMTERFPVTIDKNPMVEDQSQTFVFDVRKENIKESFKVTADRYIANAEYVERLEDTGANEDRPGVEFMLQAPGSNEKTLVLEGHPQRGAASFGNAMLVSILTVANDEMKRGLGRRTNSADIRRGRLEVLDAAGTVLTTFDILAGEREMPPWRGLPLEGKKTVAAGGGLTISLDRFFGCATEDRSRGWIDADPNNATMPAVTVRVDGKDGQARYIVNALGETALAPDLGQSAKYDLRFRYRTQFQIPLAPSSIVFAVGPGDEKAVVITDSRGKTRTEEWEANREYRFSEEAPIRIKPTRFVRHANLSWGYEKAQRSTDQRVLRVHVQSIERGESATTWVLQQQEESLNLGGLTMRIGYEPRPVPLDFSLTVLDFRTIHYPNGMTPKAFETNAVIHDPARGVEEAVLIDMNHPLDYHGLRFFNSSPIDDERSKSRGVVLQVTSNPGYPAIIVGSIAVTIGIVVVFFFKGRLRRYEESRRRRSITPAIGGPATIAPPLTVN